MNRSVGEQNRSIKEWTNEKLARVKSQVKGLKSFATHVEAFCVIYCSSGEYRASALGATFGQDEEEADSGGRSLSGTRTAAISSSSTRPPAYICKLLNPQLLRPLDLLRVLLRFSTLERDVRAGAIRIEINNPDQWTPGEVAILRNQEAKRVRDIGSLIFDAPIQHDYEAGVEVRSLLPTGLTGRD